MSSVKVTVFGRIKPCPRNLLSQAYRVEYGEREDYIAFASTKAPSGNKRCRFQKIFGTDASQDQVFKVVAKPIIKNFLSGYNGTIFTYGQTGSGKTFTMTGDIEKWVHPGLIPRTIQEIFNSKTSETTVTVTYCEIYNEHVYDLIRVDRVDTDLPQVSILEDSTGITHFRNLSEHIVANAYEALQLLIRGDANKMVAETASNAKSSRSHVIFSIALDLPHPKNEKMSLKPTLYLVDLAGSEKMSKCKSPTSNPWETRYINLSLHYLEQVLIALRQPGRAHIPYRNSLMTALLRNSLGGNCITAMIATFSLSVEDIEETIQTCRFAERIALIKNEVKLNEIVTPKKEIDMLKKENERLKAQLKLLTKDEEFSEELSNNEKEKCAQIVQNYIRDSSTFELPFTNIKKTEYCFWLMREKIKNSETDESVTSNQKSDTASNQKSDTASNQKSDTASNQNSDTDFLKILAGNQNDGAQSQEVLKMESEKESKNLEKIYRRKRNPVDLPKVNITYKRWKSTEQIPGKENVVFKTSKTVTSKETQATVQTPKVSEESTNLELKQPEYAVQKTKLLEMPSDHSNLSKILSENSLFQPDSETNAFVLTGFILKDKDKNIMLESDNSGVKFQTLQEIKPSDEAATSEEAWRKPKDSNSTLQESIQSEENSGEGFPVETLGETKEDFEDVNEVKYVESIQADEESSCSEESSRFSMECLPLTGDPEVDEEILKFYKSRYELFKNDVQK